MKLCKDCKHCRAFKCDESGSILFYHCTLRSPLHGEDPVTGDGGYYSSFTAVPCKKERQDSTGFFGLFIDKDRCGVEAKNFKPRENK
jgi:hypothetical protein